MQIPLYQVDAFTQRVFQGNPAAVCPLESWLTDAQMQAIAAENNLSETVFLVPAADRYQLRWFTPTVEVDLCGHATLAAAFVVLTYLHPAADQVRFDSRSGELIVRRQNDLLQMDFPSLPPQQVDPPAALLKGLDRPPVEVWKAGKYMAVYHSEQEVRALQPTFSDLLDLDGDGVIVTAPADSCDFVSRYFAPHAGIPEDPVTGSAHCTLIPYWAQRLGKTELHARQVSARGGELFCQDLGQRVRIAGRAVPYLQGIITLP